MRISTIICFALVFSVFSCNTPPDTQASLEFESVGAPEWDDLFLRYSGWFGGDGIFAIPASGIEYQEEQDSTENIILFSDTMVGEIEEGELQDGFHMVNNSIAYMNGKTPSEDNISFHVDVDSSGQSTSLFPMLLEDVEDGEYYWLGDGFTHPQNGNTYVFAYRVIDRPELPVFAFDIMGGALITLPKGSRFPFEDQQQRKLPFFYKTKPQVVGSYGAGILMNIDESKVPNPDGYIYIYGVRDPGKELLVARVTPAEFETFESWTFWNGDAWVTDFQQAVAVTDSVSNELSVTPLPNGQYALVFTAGGVTPTVDMKIGESPIGPFGPMQSIWDCSEALEEEEFFAYNAKAHPTLSQPGELLISYNVNSFAFWDQVGDYPNLYRPRFFRLKYK